MEYIHDKVKRAAVEGSDYSRRTQFLLSKEEWNSGYGNRKGKGPTSFQSSRLRFRTRRDENGEFELTGWINFRSLQPKGCSSGVAKVD
jgi:hypothetical protein